MTNMKANEVPTDVRVEFLKKSSLWRNLSDEILTRVASSMNPESYSSGHTIIRQGDAGSHFHLILSGKVEVVIRTDSGSGNVVASLGAGECFGEMSLLTGDEVSASIVACEGTETLSLDRPALDRLMAENPELLKEFVNILSERLRNTGVAVSETMDKENELAQFIKEDQSDKYTVLLGNHASLRQIKKAMKSLTVKDSPVFIQGERGTGKELVGRLIHVEGPRNDAPLLSVECEQIAQTPWGDKLFGALSQESGTSQPRGVCYMALARGGTLILKNIEMLPPALQQRLRQHLEKSPSSVRLIATSREDIAGLLQTGQMDSGLASLLGVDMLTLVPLRDRKKDIPALVRHFIEKHSKRQDKEVTTIEDEAISKIIAHHFALGNVQELEDIIERAVILTDGESITVDVIFLGQPPDTETSGINLLEGPKTIWDIILKVFPGAIRIFVALFFAGIVGLCIFATSPTLESIGTGLTWMVWWPGLIISFFLLGRMWCAICPMALAGNVAQKFVHLDRRIPSWLKRHDTLVIMAGFILIMWAEEGTAMRHSAGATGILLLTILTGAVATSVVFPRRTWCRYICPLGGFAGLCSTTSLIELRPTFDLCSAKCSGHACYKGEGKTAGCPMFNHVMFVDSNQHCVLCLNCIKSCPNSSPRFNLRIPARELWTRLSPNPAIGQFVVVLLGLLMALVWIQTVEMRQLEPVISWMESARLLTVSGIFALCIGTALALLSLFHLHVDVARKPELDSLFWQRIVAWTPLVVTGFACYQFAYFPGLASTRFIIDADLINVTLLQSENLILFLPSITLLTLVRMAVLTFGVVLSLLIFWKIRDRGKQVGFLKETVSVLPLWGGTCAYALLLWTIMIYPF